MADTATFIKIVVRSSKHKNDIVFELDEINDKKRCQGFYPIDPNSCRCHGITLATAVRVPAPSRNSTKIRRKLKIETA